MFEDTAGGVNVGSGGEGSVWFQWGGPCVRNFWLFVLIAFAAGVLVSGRVRIIST